MGKIIGKRTQCDRDTFGHGNIRKSTKFVDISRRNILCITDNLDKVFKPEGLDSKIGYTIKVPSFLTVKMRKMLSHFLLFYSTFLVVRTTFSFKSLSRSASPTAGQYYFGKYMNPIGYRDPSLINQFTCGTALNMASLYGNVIGGDLTKVCTES